ncbi:uncharacterized protein LOC110834745 isoform X2 [Zootermopsis nevadensis]|uniref:uncharacterized protein LOC110834745 isoform X2 n=1 Tax=Zootermopsis nevadensis TaxID=136037 RepID=UPI000B8E31D1|nr:uncharacterized protein LOC110834745 isoform X2 [Zootermopsis nevadensis]
MDRPCSPQPRKSIHSYKMGTNGVHRSQWKYAKADELKCELLDSNESGDTSKEVKVKEEEEEEESVDKSYQEVSDRTIPESSAPLISGGKSPTSHSSPKRTTKKKDQASWITKGRVRFAVCVLGFVGYICYLQTGTETVLSPSSVKVSESERLRKDIDKISYEFPSQPNITWRNFRSGIKIAQDPSNPKPAVFLLLHELEDDTPACLAMKIGKVTASFLNATNREPLILEGLDFEHNETLVEDYGIILDEFCPKVKEKRAVIVNNLHKIHGKIAQSFQFFCDGEKPLVNNTVYIFTMKALGVNHASDNPTSLAEKELKKLWGGQLDDDVLTPLIVRITDITMVISPERNPASCFTEK